MYQIKINCLNTRCNQEFFTHKRFSKTKTVDIYGKKKDIIDIFLSILASKTVITTIIFQIKNS